MSRQGINPLSVLMAAGHILQKGRYLLTLNTLVNSQLFQFNTLSDSKCALCISSSRPQQIRWTDISLQILA